MNETRFLRILGPLFLTAVVFGQPKSASACAPAPPLNKPVAIADEVAIIILDQAAKTEHFIRRASFHTEAHDFGFLVPTPAKPTLAEAGDDAFTELARITAPRVVTRSRPAPGLSCGCAMAPPPAGLAAPVRVLEEKRVAGYDAVVLEADAPDALSRWLKEHGYEFSPALADWAAPYVKAGWKVTAFKVAKESPEAPAVATSAVRMTFQTDRPFFPYREPASQAPSQATAGLPSTSRMLRVFFLGEKKVEGVLGEGNPSWPGSVAWANQLSGEDREKLLQLLKLPKETPPASWWLTEFEDPSSPRPGTADVYFSTSADQAPKEREPHIEYVSRTMPDFMCYALAGYMAFPYVVRRLRRKG